MTILRFNYNTSPEIFEESIELQSNRSFDNVKLLKTKKPDPRRPGFRDNPSLVKLDNVTPDKVMLPESPNLYKQRGDFMVDEGFIRFPRSLFNDPHWKGMRTKYQKVFLTLLFHTSFTQRSYSVGANVITIGPGQFCTSIRALIDLCNEGVKFKEDKIDKNIVERSVSLFTKIGFVRQEVRHKKSIFTISYPGLYEHFQNKSETRSETKPRHNRDINEERKERKEHFRLKGTSNVKGSPLSNKKIKEEKKEEIIPFTPPKISQSSREDFEGDLNLIKYLSEENKIPFQEKEMIRWVKKYGGYSVKENILLMLKGNKKIDNPGAWMETALKDDWAKAKANIPKNAEFAKSFKAINNWLELDVGPKFCAIRGSGFDLDMRMDEESFQRILQDKYEILRGF